MRSVHKLAIGESTNDTPAVSRVIAATAEEEISTIQRDRSVLIEHSLQAVPADEDEQPEKDSPGSSDAATEGVDARSPEDL